VIVELDLVNHASQRIAVATEGESERPRRDLPRRS
jgi:hypothetical protein